MRVEQAIRVFNYNGVKLADPNPSHTPEQVQSFYSAMYPEINSATVEGPEIVGRNLVYSIRRSVGTKG